MEHRLFMKIRSGAGQGRPRPLQDLPEDLRRRLSLQEGVRRQGGGHRRRDP